MIGLFWDEETGNFYDTVKNKSDLIIRPRTISTPLPLRVFPGNVGNVKNGPFAWKYTFRGNRSQVSPRIRGLLARNPLSFSNWLCALDFYLSDTMQIAIFGPSGNPTTNEFLYALHNKWLPNCVIAASDPGDPSRMTGLSLFENRDMIAAQPTVYVCHRHSCQTPTPTSISLRP